MERINKVTAQQQGPSTLLFTVYDNENYLKHREMLFDTERTMDTLKVDHLKSISNAKTLQLKEERATEIERENRILFEKIERIINRQGPFKLQQSKNNPSRFAKIYHAPSDNVVTASTYFPRPAFNMTTKKKEQRQTFHKQIQEENQKVLERLRSSKPSIDLDEFAKHTKTYLKLKKMRNKQFDKAKHGYPARGMDQFNLSRTDSLFRQTTSKLPLPLYQDPKLNYQFQVQRHASVLRGTTNNSLLEDQNLSATLQNFGPVKAEHHRNASMNKTMGQFGQNSLAAEKPGVAPVLTPQVEQPKQGETLPVSSDAYMPQISQQRTIDPDMHDYNAKKRHVSLPRNLGAHRGRTSPLRRKSPKRAKEQMNYFASKFKMPSSRLPPQQPLQSSNPGFSVEESAKDISQLVHSKNAQLLQSSVDAAGADYFVDQERTRLRYERRASHQPTQKRGQILLKSGLGSVMSNEKRTSLYRAKIELDDFGTRMDLDIQKDSKKMYLIVCDPETRIRKVMELYLKQAIQVLMYCHNDFRRFVAEIIQVKHDRITLKDINSVISNLTNQNLEIQANFLEMAQDDEEYPNGLSNQSQLAHPGAHSSLTSDVVTAQRKEEEQVDQLYEQTQEQLQQQQETIFEAGGEEPPVVSSVATEPREQTRLEVKQDKRIEENSATKIEILSAQPPERLDSLPAMEDEKKKEKRVTILEQKS